MLDNDALEIIVRRLDAIDRKIDSLTRNPIPEYLSVKEAAARLGVSTDSIHRLCQRREIRFVQTRPNATKRISSQDLADWAERNTTSPLRK